MKNKKQTLNNIFTGVTIGLFAGIVICLFRFLMTLCDTALNKYIFPLIHSGAPLVIFLWAAALAALACIVHALICFEPDARGGGIPHAIKESEGTSDSRWWSVLISKLAAAPLCILAGLSLGKTGPAVELGYMAGKGIGSINRRISKNQQSLAGYGYHGCAAGLAALFNAPLAGMWFACEKLKRSDGLSSITTLVSAFTAFCVSIAVFGYTPLIDCTLPVGNWKLYACCAFLGIITGTLGCFYAKSLSFTTDKLEKLQLRGPILWVLVFLAAGVAGYFTPEITGGGWNMLAVMYGNHVTFHTLALLLAGKYLFSMLSCGSQLPGGTVFPLLTIGGCLGQLFGMLVNTLIPSIQIPPAMFILPGMAGFFSSVLDAPCSGMFLACEFTCNYRNLPPLLVVGLISRLVAKRLPLIQPQTTPLYHTAPRHNK